MSRAKDPITAAAATYLWPYLKSIGFSKVTPRKYAREENGVVQQLWIDANGVRGKRGILVVLCANFVFGSVSGYMDPHGFRMSNGKTWNMSTHEAADFAMQQVVNELRNSELRKLDELSSVEAMLSALENFRRKDWFEKYAALAREWEEGDIQLLKVAENNRIALKLSNR